ncbi:hypothetical protein M407DRAFT_47230, partial [Tulasnella calospora MUT 4182]
ILLRTIQYQLPNPEDHPDLPASDPLWGLIHRCWDRTPAARPTITEIRQEV